MHFYPSVRMREWLWMARENPELLMGLRRNMVAIRARERLERQDDIAISMSEEDQARQFKINIAQEAFEGDEETLSTIVEALTRKKG
jgi:hypothetical protein